MGKKLINKLEKRAILMISIISLIVACIPIVNAEENLPPIADAGGPYIDYEGNTVLLNASQSYDPDNDPIFFNWDLDGDGFMDLRFWLDDPTIEYTWYDDYVGIIKVFVKDDHDHITTDDSPVTIYNLDPIILTLDGLTSDPMQIGETISLSCTFTDPGILDTHLGYIDWGDGILDTPPISDYSFCGSHDYSEPGVYTVSIKVEDDDGGFDIVEFQYVVIYDPNIGGFVSGGGWINSPAGAYTPDPTLEGTANFGFVSKYKKGQSIPTGSTEFNYHVGSLNFHSNEYEWLIVAGPKAIYKGTGTINNAGNFGFMLSVIDEKLTPSTDIDLFRIKIWDKDNNDVVIYDNNIESNDNDDPNTEIAGGQIVIHK